MQIVIDIDEKDYRDFQLQAVMLNPSEPSQRAKLAIANGTPLPKGHGRLIDVEDLARDFKASRAMSICEIAKAACIINHAYDKKYLVEADKEGEDSADND